MSRNCMTAYKPLNLVQSVLIFGLSAAVFRLSVYHLMPYLQAKGVTDFSAFLISYGVPLTLMMLATAIGLRLENNLPHWKSRLRLKAISIRTILVCIGFFLLSFLLTGLLIPTAKFLASTEWFRPPDFLPDILNPNKSIPGAKLEVFMGIPLKGAYWILPVYFIFLTFFNILGEELWFRGYLLPRQELTWGRFTWIYHGVLWSLFHVPIYPWTVIYLLPTTLAVSFVAQRFQNTWAGFIIHYLGNGILALVPIAMGVLQ